ncbi:hypothetical protein RB653_001162 [Dictyostelium firmibasis]|uniref:Uncharacterized protein n=1 Tax=Dictyostelium firmibasis TaxID=79012 RepID=A0AAN7YR92_9MYCE
MKIFEKNCDGDSLSHALTITTIYLLLLLLLFLKKRKSLQYYF